MYIDNSVMYQIMYEVPDDRILECLKIRNQMCGSNGVGDGKKFVISDGKKISRYLLESLRGDVVFSGGIEHKGVVFSRTERSEWNNGLNNKINKERIFNFIYTVFGVNCDDKRRGYPSAGGNYPVNIIFICRSEEMDNYWNMYHLLPTINSIEAVGNIPEEELRKVISSSDQVDVFSSDFIVFYGVIPYLTIAKYGLRGYKFSLIEVGLAAECGTLLAAENNIYEKLYGYYDERGISEVLGFNENTIFIELMHLFKFKGDADEG